MNIEKLKLKPLWQMTGEEFLLLHNNSYLNLIQGSKSKLEDKSKNLVYGITGIARLFDCSIPTANRIKKSGKIDQAITQIGRKIVIDADLALELAGKKNGGRS